MYKEGCIFCGIARRKINAKAVFEDGEILAFDDKTPQAPVHVVIIPKDHIDSLSDTADEASLLVGNLIMTAKKIAIQKKISESGYRVVINCNQDGGQAVFHLHAHLLGGRALGWPPG